MQYGNESIHFSMYYGNDTILLKSKRETTQDILKVWYGNDPIFLKVLADFDSILCERVIPK